MARQLLIPYDESGSIPWALPWDAQPRWNSFTESFDPDPRFTWKEAKPFMARLRFTEIMAVRSGATVRMMNDDTGATYPMKTHEFALHVPSMTHGVTPVWVWEPYKSGQNYNIRRVDADD